MGVSKKVTLLQVRPIPRKQHHLAPHRHQETPLQRRHCRHGALLAVAHHRLCGIHLPQNLKRGGQRKGMHSVKETGGKSLGHLLVALLAVAHHWLC